MKNYYLFLFILCFCFFNSKGQNTNVITGLSNSRAIATNEGILYVTDNFAGGGRIFKYDISATSPTVETIISDLPHVPETMAFHGNNLYYVLPNYQSSNSTIYKIDITEQNPSIYAVFTSPIYMGSIKIFGDDLYFYHNNGNGTPAQIYKFDVTESINVIPVIINNINEPLLVIRSLAFSNNQIFFATSSKIFSADLTQPTPSAVEIGCCYNVIKDIEINNNWLYALDYASEKLIRLDLSSNPVSSLQIQNLHPTSWDMSFSESGDLYVVKVFGTVYKFNSDVLSINEYQSNLNSTIFPNPSQDFISMSNITKSYNFKIFNILGMEISDGLIEPNDKIDIRNLRNGIYFLILENGYTQKFVKN